MSVTEKPNADNAPDEAKKPVAPSIPKWQAEAMERLKTTIRRIIKPLGELVERDANEGDTCLLITDFLCEGLGYDKYCDLTTEYRVRGEFADYGIRIDKQLVAFLEVKRAATILTSKHLRQVETYAVNEGVEWVVLTNGAVWQVYHITGGLPIGIDLACEVNLLSDANIQSKAAQLFYLSRESLKRRQIDEVWAAKRATSPRSLAQIVCSPAVIDEIRKELRRQTGHNAQSEDILTLLKTTVLRPDCIG